ncbi:expressed unknown protein [Seminavis robusta]|uniref:Uncharacterized protein n=1 Tax=Seminavis robusta TaxID=568900 RepID=A0A9N8DLW9_9STRA|nr:expressed unknown protein [Seminavis robusta]|eukprot:Sro156_g070970.1 n/a (308) ;mRNA; f:95813-96736
MSSNSPTSAAPKRIRRRFRSVKSAGEDGGLCSTTTTATSYTGTCSGAAGAGAGAGTSTTSGKPSSNGKERKNLRRNRTGLGSLQAEREKRDKDKDRDSSKVPLRRTKSSIARIGTQYRRPSLVKKLEQQQQQANAHAHTHGNVHVLHGHAHVHSVNATNAYAGYSFWSSRPALVMFVLMGLAIHYQNIKFVYATILLFLYETTVIVQTWTHYINHITIMQEFRSQSLDWLKYYAQQTERFFDTNDRTRKAAVGIWIQFYPVTSEYVGDYIRERRHHMIQTAAEQTQTFKNRFYNLNATTSTNNTTED